MATRWYPVNRILDSDLGPQSTAVRLECFADPQTRKLIVIPPADEPMLAMPTREFKLLDVVLQSDPKAKPEFRPRIRISWTGDTDPRIDAHVRGRSEW